MIQVRYVHNESRSRQKFLPASTFKIPNTLIGLEENIIKGESHIFEWDGVDKGLAAWNRNQTLGTAFSVSCIWCYQWIAEKVGNEGYLKYLEEFHYGNLKTGSDTSNFWLEGDLAISALEQIEFIKKVYLGDLPVNKKNIDILKEIMVVEESPGYRISAKTGWANRIAVQHGWYVGYIETKEGVWLFVNNIRVTSRADLKLRKDLVIESLKLKGII